jgi:hypothetical protein
MSNFSKERFLGGKLTSTSIFRRIGEVWESQNAVVPDRVLNRLDVPPFMSDLLLWTDGKEYDTTTHTIKSRITPQYNLTLKQGLVFSSAGAGLLNYGALNLITASTTKMRWQFKLNTVAGAGTARHIFSAYQTVGSKRSWDWYITTGNKLAVLIGANGGGSASVAVEPKDAGANSYAPQSGDIIDIKWDSGIITVLANGTTTYIHDASATQTAIYNNNSPDLNVGGYLSSATASFNGALCCFRIWVDNILDTDTPKFVAPMGDKQGIDLISGTIPAVVGTVDMTARSDDASYDCDENGCAIQTGKIYPKNYAGTGYAGLVGDPDATYQGLIALKGQIEIAGQALLGTLFDFTHDPNTEIENAGIIIHGAGAMDGENCNSNNILTAETSLNTSYPNALTASVLNTESIQVFNGTNNANQRVFVKVSNPVYKADNSSLLESGTITDILVYKRDLTPDEQVRVMIWCHNLDFLSVDLVKVGAEYLFVDDNIVYVCKV